MGVSAIALQSENRVPLVSRYFGVSAEFWLGLKIEYELRVARRTVGAEIGKRVHPYAA